MVIDQIFQVLRVGAGIRPKCNRLGPRFALLRHCGGHADLLHHAVGVVQHFGNRVGVDLVDAVGVVRFQHQLHLAHGEQQLRQRHCVLDPQLLLLRVREPVQPLLGVHDTIHIFQVGVVQAIDFCERI